MTRFTELVGCEAPVQQAPMGVVASDELVAAVATAGGLGTFTAMGMTAGEVGARLDVIRSMTDGAVAANFLTRDIDREAVEVAGAKARVVDLFWREPDAELVKIAHAGGALVCWQVGSVAEAQAAEEAGCDVVCVQGTEAGGHVWGVEALLPLLCATLDRVKVPVLAAGGIASPRAVAAVMAAGASGVRVGTRFIATEESGAHPDYVRAVVDAGPSSTAITGEFSVCPLCAMQPTARVLWSAVEAVRSLDTEDAGAWGGRPVPARAGLPPSRDVTGRIDAMALYAGAGVGLIDDVPPAAEVVRTLTASL